MKVLKKRFSNQLAGMVLLLPNEKLRSLTREVFWPATGFGLGTPPDILIHRQCTIIQSACNLLIEAPAPAPVPDDTEAGKRTKLFTEKFRDVLLAIVVNTDDLTPPVTPQAELDALARTNFEAARAYYYVDLDTGAWVSPELNHDGVLLSDSRAFKLFDAIIGWLYLGNDKTDDGYGVLEVLRNTADKKTKMLFIDLVLSLQHPLMNSDGSVLTALRCIAVFVSQYIDSLTETNPSN